MTKARDLANGGFGLVLVKPSTVVNGTDNGKGTVSFSAASSISLNDVFSSTYDNYRIVCRFTDTVSGGSNIDLRLRVGGADASGANTYKHQLVNFEGGSTSTGRYNLTSMIIGGSGTSATQLNTWALDMFSPNLATATTIQSASLSNYDNAYMRFSHGNHAVATAYTGFTFFSDGNMTGTISVYGYNN